MIASSLVMMDKETDSYWSLMTGEALVGEYEGTRLEELPVGEKIQWKDWVARYPRTLVLSIDGIEHEPVNPYANYFESEQGFRGSRAADERLPTKTSIYAFQRDGKHYAVPFAEFEGGAVVEVGEHQVFLYRPAGVAIFYSTSAFISAGEGFVRRDGVWHHVESGARFDSPRAAFVNGQGAVARLDGFDTFWFNWSMSNPETEILRAR